MHKGIKAYIFLLKKGGIYILPLKKGCTYIFPLKKGGQRGL